MNSYFERTWKEAAGVRISVSAWRHWKNHEETWIIIAGLFPEVWTYTPRCTRQKLYWLNLGGMHLLADFRTWRASAILLCVVYSENSRPIISVNKDPTESRVSAVTQLVLRCDVEPESSSPRKWPFICKVGLNFNPSPHSCKLQHSFVPTECCHTFLRCIQQNGRLFP